jgi:Mg2+ and Co2+ transporter CorA
MKKMTKALKKELFKEKFPIFYESMEDLKYTIDSMIEELENRIDQLEELQEKMDDVESMKSELNVN